MKHLKHYLGYGLFAIAVIGLLAWNIIAEWDNQYYKGIKDASTFVKCKQHLPWTSDINQMKSREINDCLELTALIDTTDDWKVAEPEGE